MKYSQYFFIFALLSGSLYPKAKDHEHAGTLKHYATHIVTGGVAKIALVATPTVGYLVGMLLAVHPKDFPTFIGRKLGITPANMQCENSLIIGSTIAIPALAGLAAGLYIMYKTPQWTDTYLLESQKKRTTSRNILTFLSRIILPDPIGVVVGELIIENDLVATA